MISCKIVFISNFFNHHQKPFSDAMYAQIADGYLFVETEEMTDERKKMGWGEEKLPQYVVQNYVSNEKAEECQRMIDDADCVIIGSAPNYLVENRIRQGKLVIRYSERPLKKGFEWWKYPYRYMKWHKRYPKKANVYMLCASAYTAGDYAKFGLFKKRCYKWGYFPAVKHYDDIDKIIELKRPASILWVARLIDWKHPELPIMVAKRLKAEGYVFALNMIGTGALEEDIKRMIETEHLSDCVHMLGSMKPEQVREHMEKSEVFMFTSDRNEGWGAVLNEAMNSGCAVVASHAIGAVPFLLNDGENGFVYKDGDAENLYCKVKRLLDNGELRHCLGGNAYRTIADVWSADEAAKRFMVLVGNILKGEKSPQLFKDGPCSKAEIMKDNWCRG